MYMYVGQSSYWKYVYRCTMWSRAQIDVRLRDSVILSSYNCLTLIACVLIIGECVGHNLVSEMTGRRIRVTRILGI